jgi:hypothetical protein
MQFHLADDVTQVLEWALEPASTEQQRAAA